ncbi:MAG: PhoX family protein [Acidimicrobiia bacterium]|nr:PhoX family protein [Acidimicrobiia bacterium]
MVAFGRRRFLQVSSVGAGALAIGGLAALSTAGDPADERLPDANGLLLPPSFASRIIATTGMVVAGTDHTWHPFPDGGACFALPDGGWSYVSNSEDRPGGVGYVRFDADATIVDAGRCLDGTVRNCAGGTTPWDTWLSCEEYDRGMVYECHPIGAVPAVARSAMGRFRHEAAACHEPTQTVYMTEDHPDGGFYRFIPDIWGELGSGTLEILTEPDTGTLEWVTVPDPDATDTHTKDQVSRTKRFDGGEGIDITNDQGVVFTSKGDNRVWRYDPAAHDLSVVYDHDVAVNGVLSGVDNLEVSPAGAIYVAEDGGDMQIVLVHPDGSTFPVVEVPGVPESEITGPAFDPSGTRLYFSSQRDPGMTFEVTGNWTALTRPVTLGG